MADVQPQNMPSLTIAVVTSQWDKTELHRVTHNASFAQALTVSNKVNENFEDYTTAQLKPDSVKAKHIQRHTISSNLNLIIIYSKQ